MFKKIKKLLVISIVLQAVIFLSGCYMLGKYHEAYCVKMEGKRPAKILDGVRGRYLVEGMNEKEADYAVWFSYSGRVSWDSYHTGGEDYRIKTMWSDTGTRWISLTFKNGVLISWARHSNY